MEQGQERRIQRPPGIYCPGPHQVAGAPEKSRASHMMAIKGFQGTSLLDFPGRIASLVFWGGCNLTCPFCHNPALVLDPEACPDLPSVEVLEALKKRRTFIDGVVISGGEPTLDSGLPEFLQAVKSLGLRVKLDTNGLAPRVLSDLVARGLVDSVAVDLKTAPERYAELHHGAVDSAALLETLRYCHTAPVDIEYRTTCVPGWIDEDVLARLGALIAGARVWALQQYHPEHALSETARTITPFSPERIQDFASIARAYAQKVIIRGC